jgi:hypothetical protein
MEPGFRAVPDSAEHQGRPRPFFDSENPAPIHQLDIGYFLAKKDDDIATGASAFGRELARFVTEAAEGPLADDEFEELFGRATGMVLDNIASQANFAGTKKRARQGLHDLQLPAEPTELNDIIMDNFELLERLAPRSMQLLDRFWNEPRWGIGYKVALRKLCLVFVMLRVAHESGRQ